MNEHSEFIDNPNIDAIVLMYFPENRQETFNVMHKLTEKHKENQKIVISPSKVWSLKVMESCRTCQAATRHCKSSSNVVPDEVFKINKGMQDFIMHRVSATKLKQLPCEEIHENSYYEMFKINKPSNSDDDLTYNFTKVEKIHNRALVFNYDCNITSSHKQHMFALFSQSNHLHYCEYPCYPILRKSELHRNICFVKFAQTKQYSRVREERLFIVIFSYLEDIYVKFPNNDFFRNRDNPNDTFMLQLKKSSESSFNYILSSQETLRDVLIYGEYQTRQVTIGKDVKPDSSKEDIKSLIEPTGHAVFHTMTVQPYQLEGASNKVTTYSEMEYAVHKFLELPVPKKSRSKKKPEQNEN